MLRIPTATDTTPPLLAPIRKTSVREESPEEGGRRIKKRRKGRKGGAHDHSWESGSEASGSSSTERKQMRLMLIGGAAILALVLAGVIYSTSGSGKTTEGTPTASIGDAAPAAGQKPASDAAVEVPQRPVAALIAEGELLTRKFLEAKSPDEIIPLVRNPEVSGPRILKFYQDREWSPPGLSKFNVGRSVGMRGRMVSFELLTADFEKRVLAFFDGPEGMKVDWESWVGWSEIPWKDFMAQKSPEPRLFRVTLSTVVYYNFDFADETKWQSYRLTSPDGEHSMYGYIEKGSALDKQVRPAEENGKLPLTLLLKFPTDPSSGNQVLIDKVVAEGWVEEEMKP